MSADTPASEMLGQFINGRFIPRMAGGEGDPPGGDPPKGDDDPPTGKDGKPFDAERAQRLIDQQRDEIKALKVTSKELADARARLKEIEDKDKSEVERLAGSAKEAGEKLTAAEARAQDLAIRLSVAETASSIGIAGPSIKAAVRLLDQSALEFDADGTPTNVEAALKALVKEYPMLASQAGGDDGKAGQAGQKMPHARPNNGKPPDKTQADIDSLRATGRYSI